ncbi:protein lysB [Burkholderia sp. ISTR5]|uniref:protein lysB n=1 Tax=Burkholderia sp. ISTR5 TaxID=2500161 RepID=UPI00191BE35E|nr:protein lysB [Burkholderia sp. ISTR5]
MNLLSPLLVKLLAGAVLVAAVAAGVMYVRALRAERDDLSDKVAAAKHDVQTRDAVISGLRTGAADLGRQQQKLDTDTNRVEAAATARRQEIRKAVYENSTARTWADTPLPDDVVRLSATPARTGAGDIGAAVPAPVAVRAASAVAAN